MRGRASSDWGIGGRWLGGRLLRGGLGGGRFLRGGVGGGRLIRRVAERAVLVVGGPCRERCDLRLERVELVLLLGEPCIVVRREFYKLGNLVRHEFRRGLA